MPKFGGIASLLVTDTRASVKELVQKMQLVELINGEYEEKILDG